MFKKIILAVVLLAGTFSASAFDIKDLLKGSSNSSSSSSQSSSSTASNILNQISSAVSNYTASSNFDVNDLVGTWKYSSPAVAFKSESALSNIGGAAAATTVENKLKTYYNKLGANNVVLTVNSDLSFTMKMKFGSLTGTISKESDQLYFNFAAFGKYSIGKVGSIATKSGSTLNLTFDASKLISILKKVSSIANNSSLTAATTLLSTYDGIYVGFKLKKQ
jgi:hypothetical protein